MEAIAAHLVTSMPYSRMAAERSSRVSVVLVRSCLVDAQEHQCLRFRTDTVYKRKARNQPYLCSRAVGQEGTMGDVLRCSPGTCRSARPGVRKGVAGDVAHELLSSETQ